MNHPSIPSIRRAGGATRASTATVGGKVVITGPASAFGFQVSTDEGVTFSFVSVDALPYNTGAASVQIRVVTMAKGFSVPVSPITRIIILILGQSNNAARDTADGLGGFGSNVWAWNGTTLVSMEGLYELPNPDSLVGTGRMGNQITLAAALRATYPDAEIVFVPCAVGGSGFRDTKWAAGGSAYTGAVSRINSYFSAYPDDTVAMVDWVQGEWDVPYHSEWTGRVTDLRTRLMASCPKVTADTPWTFGQIPLGLTNSGGINSRIIDLPRLIPHSAVVSNVGLTVFDAFHYDAASTRTFGTRKPAKWAEAEAGALYGQPIPTGTLLAEWYLGSDNPTYAAVGGGNALTVAGTTPTLAAGYARLPASSGLLTPFDETAAHTMIAICRMPAAAAVIIMGAPAASPAGWWMYREANANFRLSARSQPWAIETSLATLPVGESAEFHAAFVAFGNDPAGTADTPPRYSVWGYDERISPTTTASTYTARARWNPSLPRPNLSGLKLGFGNPHNYTPATYTGAIDIAYGAVYSGRLSDDNLIAAVGAARTACAGRGLTMLAGPT
ncbi:MAG TPA: sialate O-acetylesterase [Rhodopseudomonas sp.]|uniref:sialate O-acetylesterase n=1 Tax=Rhodopseudomonas sp. TaxID=1078 RepID=UPI002EDAED12